MTPTDRILAAKRAGQPITPAMVCATIDSIEELDAYRRGLIARGITTDDVAAIEARRKELRA